MQGKYILALDQGTTSSRAILFDRKSNIIQSAQKEFNQIFPAPGLVEHDPDEIFESQLAVAKECVFKAGIKHSDIVAIGIANQRETTVVWNKKTGRPIHNAIVWQDRRTADFCDKLKKEGKEPLIREKTGLLADAYFSATKIQYILDNVAGARKLAENGELLFGTVDSWIIWNLTKGSAHITDASNASRTLLYNIKNGSWDKDLLKIFNIPDNMLAKIVPSSGVATYTHPDFFGSAIPISGIGGDQQAATFGNACLKPSMAKNTYGTGCFLLMNTGLNCEKSENNLLTTVAWLVEDKLYYALEGSVYIGGAVVQWLRDGLGIIQKATDVESLIQTVEDNGGVYMVPAFTGLGAPHWNPYAKGLITGITRGTSKAHIARAALEAIAFQSADIAKAMEKDAKMPLSLLRVDGGASKNDILMQFQADILNIPVERPTVTETTALGAAYLAGLAVKFWNDYHELASMWLLDKRFEPKISNEKRIELLSHWHKAVEMASIGAERVVK